MMLLPRVALLSLKKELGIHDGHFITQKKVETLKWKYFIYISWFIYISDIRSIAVLLTD